MRKSGSSARVIDRFGAQSTPTERDGWWWLNVAPATAQAKMDPDGYHFIGGPPLILVEDGLFLQTPATEPSTGCSATPGFD